jgi:hypothetical protein
MKEAGRDASAAHAFNHKKVVIYILPLKAGTGTRLVEHKVYKSIYKKESNRISKSYNAQYCRPPASP